jgi:hypothetical protein
MALREPFACSPSPPAAQYAPEKIRVNSIRDSSSLRCSVA